MAKRKGPPKRKYSRKKGHSDFLHFKNARELVRLEMIPSVTAYDEWWKSNRPNGVPVRPDRTYAATGWVSWNDFLGNNNEFHAPKIIWMPFAPAKQYARSLGFKQKQQWLHHVKKKALPENIPQRPDLIYTEWFSWKDWLGTSVQQLVQEAIKIIPILYVMRLPNTPSNVYRINVTNNKLDVINFIDSGAHLLVVFENDPKFDWRNALVPYGKPYNYGDSDDYLVNNIHGFVFELDNILTPYKL